MGEIFYSDNPTLGLEGVYASEKAVVPGISAPSATVAAFAGKCVRGPEIPVEIADRQDFIDIFGGRDIVDGGSIEGEVWRALVGLNLGKFWCRRVVDPAAVAATLTLSAILKVDASSKGPWGIGIQAAIENATNGNANHFNLRVVWRTRTDLYENLNLFGTDNNIAIVVGDSLANLVVLTKLANGRPANVALTSLTGGTAGTLTAAHYVTAVSDLCSTPDVTAICVPESLEATVGVGAQATFNLAAGAIVNATPDNQLLTLVSGIYTNTPAQDITAAGALSAVASDRFYPFRNFGRVIDPTTGETLTKGSHVYAASALSQMPVYEHIGSERGIGVLRGSIISIGENTSDGNMELLRAAGINQLVKRKSGFGFQWARSTSTNSKRKELVDRRVKDVLINGIAESNSYFINSIDTVENDKLMQGNIETFLDDSIGTLLQPERPGEGPVYLVENVTTKADRGLNRKRFNVKAKIMNHNSFIQFEFEFGTDVVIATEAA